MPLSQIETADLPDNVFVSGVNQVVYQRNIALLDALSLMLAPTGLDIVVDLTGTVYASYYGDASNIAGFGVGIIPFIGTANSGLKALMRGTKRAIADVGIKKFILKEFGQAVSNLFTYTRKTAVADFTLNGIDDIGKVLLKKDDNITDVFVHYDNGKYWAYIEKEGKFVKEGFDEANFANFIKQKIPEGNTDPILILVKASCRTTANWSDAFRSDQRLLHYEVMVLDIDWSLFRNFILYFSLYNS